MPEVRGSGAILSIKQLDLDLGQQGAAWESWAWITLLEVMRLGLKTLSERWNGHFQTSEFLHHKYIFYNALCQIFKRFKSGSNAMFHRVVN